MQETEAPQASVEDRLADKLWGAEEPVDQAADQAEQADSEVSEDADTDAEDSAEEAQSNAVDEVEVEVEGWKGKIPAKLKAEIDKASDYTRKTQEVAEQRRMLEAEARLYQESKAFEQSASQELEQLRAIETQLEQFRKVDLSQYDSETLSRMSLTAANLREERARLQESLQQKQGQFQTKQVEVWDEMATRAREVMRKSIPEWDSVAPKLAEYALNEGHSFEVVTGYDRTTRQRVGPGIVDPTVAKTLYKAWKWDQLQTTKKSATDKASKAPPLLKPGAVDTRGQKQVEHMNFRKAIKNAKNDGEKATLIGEKLARKFNF